MIVIAIVGVCMWRSRFRDDFPSCFILYAFLSNFEGLGVGPIGLRQYNNFFALLGVHYFVSTFSIIALKRMESIYLHKLLRNMQCGHKFELFLHNDTPRLENISAQVMNRYRSILHALT